MVDCYRSYSFLDSVLKNAAEWQVSDMLLISVMLLVLSWAFFLTLCFSSLCTLSTFSRAVNCSKYGMTFESHLLIPCTQEDFEEQESNIDSEEEVRGIPLQDPLPF